MGEVKNPRLSIIKKPGGVLTSPGSLIQLNEAGETFLLPPFLSLFTSLPSYPFSLVPCTQLQRLALEVLVCLPLLYQAVLCYQLSYNLLHLHLAVMLVMLLVVVSLVAVSLVGGAVAV